VNIGSTLTKWLNLPKRFVVLVLVKFLGNDDASLGW